MESLLRKYEAKLVAAGLVEAGEPLLGGLDDALVWNRSDPRAELLSRVFSKLNINSLLAARPIEPYRSIMNYLARRTESVIQPQDCETRTFLHDLPVVRTLTPEAIVACLRRRKCVIVAPDSSESDPTPMVITYGTVSPEQTFVTFSSVCFATFVKFFSDLLHNLQQGTCDRTAFEVLDRVRRFLPPLGSEVPALEQGPFHTPSQVCSAMSQAGRQTVSLRLVDSYFGNISCLLNNVLYISQTGSSLNELEGHIDPCPLDDSSCAGITASSEYTAHVEALRRSGQQLLLHGHPPFAVILSMDCDRLDCALRGECHRRCEHKRAIEGVPIVPGEVGVGPFGLCHTLPPALEHADAAIVYGHGLFVAGSNDFNAPLRRMLDVESRCRELYFERIDRLRAAFPAP